MKKRILIPKVRLNEAYRENDYFDNDKDIFKRPIKNKKGTYGMMMSDDDDFFTDDEETLRKISSMNDINKYDEKETSIVQTQSIIEDYLKKKFGGVKFRVYVRINESIRSNKEDTVDFIIIPEVTDPLNVTYNIEDIDSEIQNNKVVSQLNIFDTDKVKSTEGNRYMTLWELIISAAKAKNPEAPDYIKAIHKVE